MPYFDLIWNTEPSGNVEYIAEHDLTPEDVEEALFNPIGEDVSRSSGRAMAYGFARDGRYIAVVYDQIDDCTLYPVTAFELEE